MSDNKKQPTEEEMEAALDALMNKFKRDPQYELKQEFGKFLMRHIDDLSPAERIRYNELKTLLRT